MKHTLAVLVENHSGVLSKISGLFSRRGFNIDSLAVGTTEDPNISRMTIVVDGDKYIIEQISKQLNKLVDVIKVWDISNESVIHELVFIKVSAPASVRNEVVEIANIFKANIIEVTKNSITIETTGDSGKITALLDMLKQFGIQEMVRTGAIAIERGVKSNKKEV